MKLVANIANGDTKLTGEAKVKKNAIEVVTRDFGKLLFDRTTGEAKGGGRAKITNLAELLEAAPDEGEARFLFRIHRNHGYGSRGASLLTIKITRHTARKIAGTIAAVEVIENGDKYKIGDVYEMEGEREVRRLDGFFETRDAAISDMADTVVHNAESYLNSPIGTKRYDKSYGWGKPFSHSYRPFTDAAALSAAIERKDSEKNMKELLRQLLIEGKQPTLVMVDAK